CARPNWDDGDYW
nr:immunoglobulin heavy chain junction region [Mus musculus]